MRQMLKGKIAQAIKSSTQAKDMLKSIEGNIKSDGDQGVDRQLILELMKGYKTCKAFEEIIELAKGKLRPPRTGLGGLLREIAIEWAFALRKLSATTAFTA